MYILKSDISTCLSIWFISGLWILNAFILKVKMEVNEMRCKIGTIQFVSWRSISVPNLKKNLSVMVRPLLIRYGMTQRYLQKKIIMLHLVNWVVTSLWIFSIAGIWTCDFLLHMTEIYIYILKTDISTCLSIWFMCGLWILNVFTLKVKMRYIFIIDLLFSERKKLYK